ncbi:MAG: thioesterase family protein [Alphaproteobacteria bacterium]
MSGRFLKIEPCDEVGRFALRVTSDLCVGLPGNAFLFGGAGLAAGAQAMRQALGRDLVWATAQYISYARIGSLLELDVKTAQAGRNVAQASVTGRVEKETIFTVLAALGERSGQPDLQWETMPDMPPPGDCQVWPLWPRQDERAHLNHRLEIRMIPGRFGATPRDGTISSDGRLRMWIRAIEMSAVDTALLAIFADFVPAAASAALGGVGGGNSLDNTLRIRRIVPTQWVMCDVHMQAAGRGFGHGDMRLFAEDGTLMATASQSLILRNFDAVGAQRG